MAEGYKDWASGDVLTAADLEDYTVKQSIMRFADATARDSALAVVKDEGMMAWLDDVNTLTLYSGSAWSTIGPVHGEGISWTPTVTQSGSVTVSVNRARYWRLGRLVLFDARLIVTGSGTGSNDVVIGGLPVAAAEATTGSVIIGMGNIVDNSAALDYEGTLRLASTTSMKIRSGSSNVVGAFLGSVTFTAALASNDGISIRGSYTAAADA